MPNDQIICQNCGYIIATCNIIDALMDIKNNFKTKENSKLLIYYYILVCK